MRPNTLHAVYSPEHAICRGGHFYATSTIQDTFSGMVHTLITDFISTNSTYPESRFILAEMINFYHKALVKQAMIKGQSNLMLAVFESNFFPLGKVTQNLMYRT